MSTTPHVFSRNVGSCHDIKELEYIACLHQSCQECREDGSIIAEDIQMLLLSRHGLHIDLHEIEEHILIDLVGNTSSHPQPVMDIRQMVSLLTIPYLVRESQEPIMEERYFEGGNTIFESVLKMILDDVRMDTGEDEYPILSIHLLRNIFFIYGEEEISDDLLQEMIDCARVGKDTSDPVLFNPEALMQALTADVQRYDPDWETKLSTHFEDVMSFDAMKYRQRRIGFLSTSPSKRRRPSRIQTPISSLNRKLTFPQIDLDADTFDSLSFMVILMTAVVTLYIGYFTTWLPSSLIRCNATTFGCLILKLLTDWFAILLQLAVLGTIIILLASIGNHAYNNKRNKGTFFKLLMTTSVIPLLTILSTINIGPWLSRKQIDTVQWAQFLTFFLAILLIILQLGQLIAVVLPDLSLEDLRSKIVASWLFSAGYVERNTKMAASFKVDKLIHNALTLHTDDDLLTTSRRCDEGSGIKTSSVIALGQYADLWRQKEVVGGFRWVVREYWTSNLTSKEGIFFGARLIGSNLAQWSVLAAFLSLVVIAASRGSSENKGVMYEQPVRSVYFNDSGSFLFLENEVNDTFLEDNNLFFGYTFDDFNSTFMESSRERTTRNLLEMIVSFPGITTFTLNEEPGSDLTEFLVKSMFDMTGLNMTSAFEAPHNFQFELNSNLFNFVVSELEKEDRDVKIMAPLITAGLTGACSIIFIAVNYLPSYIITVLKFRSGVLGSLHDPRSMYLNKMNPFFPTLLIGSSFWGAAFTGGATGFFCGSIIYLLLWEKTRVMAMTALAFIVVLIITWLLRFTVVNLIYCVVSRGFLRNKPAIHNIIVLMFETWNIGNSLGYVLARSVRVIVITIFYIGRLDKWILADGAGEVLCFHPDFYPRAYNRDLLVHEAHRHPWIERLVMMYMLKIRFGKSFGSQAGGCWRLLFVSALMPWLSSYNVTSVPESSRRKSSLSRKRRDAEDIETIGMHMQDISQRQNQAGSIDRDGLDEKDTVMSLFSFRRIANEDFVCDDSELTERSKSQRNIISTQSREAMKRARLPSEESFSQDLSIGSWNSSSYQHEKSMHQKNDVELSTVASENSTLI